MTDTDTDNGTPTLSEAPSADASPDKKNNLRLRRFRR
jgi:hypothetical protein